MRENNNQTNLRCPDCHYQRKATDTSPEWQCPSCGIAYKKIKKSADLYQHTRQGPLHNPETTRLLSHPALFRIGRALEILFFLFLLLFIISMMQRNKLPVSHKIVKQIQKSPIQKNLTKAQKFEFKYRGKNITIQPMAKYELWGLVVSHNDINGFIDGYDENDVNLKDICVTWGGNILENMHRQVEFSSRQWICNYRYDYSLRGRFDPDKVSNNHLLSESPAIRKAIRNIHIGDQIYLKGRLVNYTTAEMYGWRTSSLVRTDGGNGACEVFLVDEIVNYKKNNRAWFMLYDLCKWLMIILFIFRLGLQLIDVYLTKLR